MAIANARLRALRSSAVHKRLRREMQAREPECRDPRRGATGGCRGYHSSSSGMHMGTHMGGQGSGSRRGWRPRRACACCHEVAVAVECVVFCTDVIVRVAGISNETSARACVPGPTARSSNAPRAIARNRSTSAARRRGREVVLLEPVPTPLAAADSTTSRSASKADGLHADVLALLPLSGIKIRVSAGVLEVTLIRVLEERCSVEVPFVARGQARPRFRTSAASTRPRQRNPTAPSSTSRCRSCPASPSTARNRTTSSVPIHERLPDLRDVAAPPRPISTVASRLVHDFLKIS
ncbi:hypothetical protein B0H11DRAFT_2257579 [Mycena galericulata]|nr:hypothetical protein B0H11DRAFT_2257579 [Mycena galericulata]